jgi:sulfite reductase (NADPH) flavoprotein alpha-component
VPLRKLQPRLYSISSSPKAHPGEVHLTVAVVRYDLNGRARKGVCSTFFADRTGPDTKVPVFVHKSPSFKLPADGSKPIIMVGPGTGVAPFRAFLEERRAVAAAGRNWLSSATRKRPATSLPGGARSDAKRWILTRLDTAFSRDQAQKIYVQDRMMENAGEIWSWLQEGGSFMSAAMPNAWPKMLTRRCTRLRRRRRPLHGAGRDYVKQLKSEKRYLRDVY